VYVLDAYLRGEIDEHDLESWSEAVEVRDDIACDDIIKQVLFELSTPEINFPITPE
jgi:hypothetical protein